MPLEDLHHLAAKLHDLIQNRARTDDKVEATSKLAMRLVHEVAYLEERIKELEKKSNPN